MSQRYTNPYLEDKKFWRALLDGLNNGDLGTRRKGGGSLCFFLCTLFVRNTDGSISGMLRGRVGGRVSGGDVGILYYFSFTLLTISKSFRLGKFTRRDRWCSDLLLRSQINGLASLEVRKSIWPGT